MRVGLLPGSAEWVGGPGTYLSGVVHGLTRMTPAVRLEILLLGLSQLRRREARRRRALQNAFAGEADIPVVARPVSPRFYGSRASRIMPGFDMLFGRHDVYHQAHLDMHPAVPGRRLVLTLHDVIAAGWPDEGTLLFGADDLLGRAAAVITVSETSRKNILRRFPGVAADQVHVIWNGVDHASFGPDRLPEEAHLLQLAGIPSEFLLYVGGITKRKNVAALVDAHARLREAQAGVPPLVLVGPWGRHQLVEALGEEPGTGVLALGSVSAGTVPALMRHAVVVVAPSRDEGFGLPVLEAQACGARVVCSDIPVFREIGGPAPVYAEPTRDGLARGLELALDMAPDEVERRRNAGFTHSRAFTWDRSAAQHLEVYRLVSSGAAA